MFFRGTPEVVLHVAVKNEYLHVSSNSDLKTERSHCALLPHSTVVFAKVISLHPTNFYWLLGVFVRWRLQSASTRDHLLPSSSQNSAAEKNASSSDEDCNSWYNTLCNGFISEYKRYLQTLGFIPLQIEHNHKKHWYLISLQFNFKLLLILFISFGEKETSLNFVFYAQKAMLGGILIFTIHLTEPFLITKLHAIECSRLQTTTSRTSINQVKKNELTPRIIMLSSESF